MSGTVIPIAMWPESRMTQFLEERLSDISHAGEGIWLEEDHFFAAAFFLNIPILQGEGYEFFTYEGRNWFNGDYDEMRG